MTRLPKALALLLFRFCEPTTLGLRYVTFDGGVWVEVGDRTRFQQTIHGLQESITSGNRDHVGLLWRLAGLTPNPKRQ